MVESGSTPGTGKAYRAGVDIGASATKAVIIDEGKRIVGRYITRSGIDYEAVSLEAFEEAKKAAGIEKAQVRKIVSTGYGRDNVPFASASKTEIGCHMKGCFHYFPHAATIVDIGGQDCKVIHVDDEGRRTGFKMNRKCAAGTGAFPGRDRPSAEYRSFQAGRARPQGRKNASASGPFAPCSVRRRSWP